MAGAFGHTFLLSSDGASRVCVRERGGRSLQSETRYPLDERWAAIKRLQARMKRRSGRKKGDFSCGRSLYVGRVLTAVAGFVDVRGVPLSRVGAV